MRGSRPHPIARGYITAAVLTLRQGLTTPHDLFYALVMSFRHECASKRCATCPAYPVCSTFKISQQESRNALKFKHMLDLMGK